MEEIYPTSFKAVAPAMPAKAVAPKAPPAQVDQVESRTPDRNLDLNQAVQELNDFSSQHEISLNFVVHKESGRTQIRVIDSTTDKVIREIPPDDVLNIIDSIEEMAGKLLSTKA